MLYYAGGFHDFQATPRPGSGMTRAWLHGLSYVAIQNITSIRVVGSCTGLGHSTGEGVTENDWIFHALKS